METTFQQKKLKTCISNQFHIWFLFLEIKYEMQKKSTTPLVNFLRGKTLTFPAFSTQRSTQQQKVAIFLKSVAAWGKVCIKFKLPLNFQIFTTLVNVFETLALTTSLLSAYMQFLGISFLLSCFVHLIDLHVISDVSIEEKMFIIESHEKDSESKWYFFWK